MHEDVFPPFIFQQFHWKGWQRLLKYITSTVEVDVDFSKQNLCSFSM